MVARHSGVLAVIGVTPAGCENIQTQTTRSKGHIHLDSRRGAKAAAGLGSRNAQSGWFDHRLQSGVREGWKRARLNCDTMGFTPLSPEGGSPGIAPTLGVQAVTKE